jgi:putative (di)nucleoside polyphosphate hydrolase
MNLSEYRSNVAGIIMDKDFPKTKKVWIGLRIDIPLAWQFPQGGIDYGESEKDAFFREMKEEIGTNDVTIIDFYPEWVTYDFPSHKKGRYKGQKQKFFLAKLNENSVINIKTQIPEFKDYKFVEIEDVFEHTTKFKYPSYKKVIDHFKEKGHF